MQLIDFLRFNTKYAQQIMEQQPALACGTVLTIVRSRDLSSPSRPSTSQRSHST